MLEMVLRIFLLTTTNDAEIVGHVGPIDSYGRTTVIKQSIVIGNNHFYGQQTLVKDSLLIGRVFTTGKVVFSDTYVIGKLNTITDK
jgi:hypothetical protein